MPVVLEQPAALWWLSQRMPLMCSRALSLLDTVTLRGAFMFQAVCYRQWSCATAESVSVWIFYKTWRRAQAASRIGRLFLLEYTRHYGH